MPFVLRVLVRACLCVSASAIPSQLSPCAPVRRQTKGIVPVRVRVRVRVFVHACVRDSIFCLNEMASNRQTGYPALNWLLGMQESHCPL